MRRREMENVLAILFKSAQDLQSGCTKAQEVYEPVELDIEASNSELERMQVFERVESQATDSCCICQGAQQIGQRIGDALVCTAAVHGDGHVLLRVAKKGKVCSTVGWEAHKNFTRT
jgi:hypothetical protein